MPLVPLTARWLWNGLRKSGAGGGDIVPQLFDVVFNKKIVEQQRADPSLPQCYQSRASKTQAMAGSVFKKLVTKLKDRMRDPFAFLHPMPPGSVIVSGVESGDQLAHRDTSTVPHILAPSPFSGVVGVAYPKA